MQVKKTVPWEINPLADHNMVGYTLVEMAKDSKRRKDEWGKINMVQRMNVLGKINDKWMVVEKRTQQTLDQYL